MIKIRNKRIALLLILSMLATMIVGFGATASAASSDNGILVISKAINNSITEDTDTPDQTLGWIKTTIKAEDAVDGTVYASFTLPDGVYFDADKTDQDQTANQDVTGGSDNALEWDLDQVIVESSAADDIYVDATFTYVDTNMLTVDTFSGKLLVGKKGDANVTVTAASPKAVSMGTGKKIAKVTLAENLPGAIQAGSEIVMELPDKFSWDSATITDGLYGLANDGYSIEGDNDELLRIYIDSASAGIADKLKIVGYINVDPDAPDGDVVVSVYDDSTSVKSHVPTTDLTVAVVGGAEVTVTAKDTTSSADYIYRAQEGKTLWDITLEANAAFAEGDDLLLTLPAGMEFMEEQDADFGAFDFVKLYNDNQSMWLVVADGNTASKTTLSGITVGVKPAAKTGDLVVTMSGDVVDTTVVASTVVDKLTVTAAKTSVKAGLGEKAGDITMVENKAKPFVDGDEIFMQAAAGVTFASAPTLTVNGEVIDDAITLGSDYSSDYDDDVIVIELDNLKTADKDKIVISDIALDIDSRYTAGKDIAIKIGGIDKDFDYDMVNLLSSEQFDKEADDSLYSVVVGTVGTPGATNVIFTIGASSYVKDGATVVMDVAPFAENGRTYVPVRFIANALGVSDANIYWDGVNQTVTLIKDNNVVQFKLGSSTRLINAVPATMDVAPIAKDGRVFLPARFVAEAFGAVVGWDAAAPNVVTIAIQ